MSDLKPGSTVPIIQPADASMERAEMSRIATQQFGATSEQSAGQVVVRLTGIEATAQSIQIVKKLIDYIKTL